MAKKTNTEPIKEGEVVRRALKWLIDNAGYKNESAIAAAMKITSGTITSAKKSDIVSGPFRSKLASLLREHNQKFDDFIPVERPEGPDNILRILVTNSERTAIIVTKLMEMVTELQEEVATLIKKIK